MVLYLVVLLFCLIMSILSYQMERKEDSETKIINNNRNFKYIYVLLIVSMLLIVAFRADNIGIDTVNYKRIYYSFAQSDFNELKHYKWSDEIGFKFINILFNKLDFSWEQYSVVTSSVFILPIAYIIFKYTYNSFFSLLIFILSGFWTYPMSTVRQSIAIGVVVIAFEFERRNKNVQCVLLLFISSLFHISALASILYFLLLKAEINKDNAFKWLLSSLIIVVCGISAFQNIFIRIMQEFGRDYHTVDSTGGLMQEFFFVLTLFIGFLFTKEQNEEYWRYYKAILISAVILPIVRINPTFFRVYMFFSIYQIIFIPIMLKKLNEIKVKVIAYIAYVIVYAYLFFSQTMTESMKLIPYSFFWQK